MQDDAGGKMSEGNTTLGEEIIVCRDVHKWFDDFHVLRGVSLTVRRQEVVVICGPSGSGKSTFIRPINRLEEHQRGDIIVDGIELTHDIRNIEAIRREVGMVFQQFNLFPHLTVLQNVTLAPIWARKWPKDKAEEVAMQLLERVGIPDQALKYPGQLSGGERQRAAVVRALINEPPLLLADEPTGALDRASAEQLARLLIELNQELGLTLITVTHSLELAHQMGRILELRDGTLHPVERSS